VSLIHEHKGKQELYIEANLDVLTGLLEIAGYREVLATIHESYDYIAPTANTILQLHRELYSFAGKSAGGNYKNAANLIVETDAKGEERIRLKPVPAYQTREALQDGSEGWHEGENDYTPFVRYTLGVILNAYVEFESRVEHLKHRDISKADRVKKVFDDKIGKVSKKDIMEICPDISGTTVERTLGSLLKEGYLIKVGAGAKIGYVKK